MKTKFTILLSIISFITFAQNKVFAVKGENKDLIFYSLAEAYEASEDGDTIYLPEGSFGDLIISKKITLIGVGSNSSYNNISKFQTLELSTENIKLESITTYTLRIGANDNTIYKCTITGTLSSYNGRIRYNCLLINNNINQLTFESKHSEFYNNIIMHTGTVF